jgi:hypothetical protein
MKKIVNVINGLVGCKKTGCLATFPRIFRENPLALTFSRRERVKFDITIIHYQEDIS